MLAVSTRRSIAGRLVSIVQPHTPLDTWPLVCFSSLQSPS